jgi:hypothetical protein
MVLEHNIDTLASLSTKSDLIMCEFNQYLDQNGFGSHTISKGKLNHTSKSLWNEVQIFQNPWCLCLGLFVYASLI